MERSKLQATSTTLQSSSRIWQSRIVLAMQSYLQELQCDGRPISVKFWFKQKLNWFWQEIQRHDILWTIYKKRDSPRAVQHLYKIEGRYFFGQLRPWKDRIFNSLNRGWKIKTWLPPSRRVPAWVLCFKRMDGNIYGWFWGMEWS